MSKSSSRSDRERLALRFSEKVKDENAVEIENLTEQMNLNKGTNLVATNQNFDNPDGSALGR